MRCLPPLLLPSVEGPEREKREEKNELKIFHVFFFSLLVRCVREREQNILRPFTGWSLQFGAVWFVVCVTE